jgi:hypothetical protein
MSPARAYISIFSCRARAGNRAFCRPALVVDSAPLPPSCRSIQPMRHDAALSRRYREKAASHGAFDDRLYAVGRVATSRPIELIPIFDRQPTVHKVEPV